MKKLPIRMAVVGAHRGRSHAVTMGMLGGDLRLDAVCDVRPDALGEWHEKGEVRCYDNYQRLLDDPGIDAVCLATPLKQHAGQAVAALRAGKHVLSEVTAAWTLDECHELVNAVEESGLTYMMGENCCFFRDVMMVSEMVRQGVFGELLYAEGHYLHDCRDLYFRPDGSLTWRGQICRDDYCNWYPTHSVGPVCQWLGINRTDRLDHLSCWGTPSLTMSKYVERNFPGQATSDAFGWQMPDIINTLLRTERGIVIQHRQDTIAPRPGWQNAYVLRGTRAVFTSGPTAESEPMVWIEDRSPTSKTGHALEYEPLYNYAADFEHPLWRRLGEEAGASGHYGGDYFVLREFADAIIEGRAPLVDVYDAVTWSSIAPLSEMSMRNGNAPVKVPDFNGAALV